jgi:hypothetical protein
VSQENVAVVRRMLDAFNRDDVEAVIAAFDAGCEINEPLEMPDSPSTATSCSANWRLEGLAGAAGYRSNGQPSP